MIVFSTGNQNDPIDYAHTLELIAAGGFVVAAPYHANNTGDDVRIDYINQQAGTRLINCNDGLPPRATFGPGDCSKTNVPNSIADRVRDVSYVLNSLPGWLRESRRRRAGRRLRTLARHPHRAHRRGREHGVGRRARAARAGDHGRVDRRAGARQPGLAHERQGTGAARRRPLDATSPPAVSKFAYDNISSVDKRYVEIPNAHHRTFDSTYCDQAQSSGAIVTADPTRMVDKHTFDLMATHPTSGRTQDYCPYSAFTSPTDVTGLLFAANGFAVTPTNVPTTGLTVDTVKQQVAELAIEFFAAKLARAASGGVSGTVPATLSLTLGPAPSFGAFTPGVNRTYTATGTANVISTAGDAALSVTDPSTMAPGRLVNGAFSLASPLLVGRNPLPAVVKSWTSPVSNDPVQIAFSQTIGAEEALRTGTYSKTLTFTLSTTSP